ncbi:MAG: UbiA family prenyltransferase [Thiohalophilus sp.]|uniref:UbiA family prenyltransferase n=1 Tax=Thiohalophilus sp. TaxID=3028392 RepID=UPI0028701FF6|nr:UbiA family prenyltransferase [Thiohalophilus sp.]MDR9437157.1 UbiA family prenyltransferase [Thiohalophilus sp.]
MSDTSQLPLAVDMDGTLVHSDTLWEACLRLLAERPWLVLLLPFWLLGGKTAFKQRLSEHVRLDPQTLPYNQPLLEFLQAEKQRGRPLWLVTASHPQTANAVADYIGLFDGVLASDARCNLSGSHKAERLVETFGEGGFVYAANAAVDLKIWRRAAAAIVVNAGPGLTQRANSVTALERIFPRPGATDTLKTLLRAMRLHQWSKNGLIFVPLVLSHSWGATDLVMHTLLAFIAFGCAASAIYLVNDLIDLEADRLHHEKRHRPFAAGLLPLPWGIAMIPVLLVVAFTIASTVNSHFMLVLVIYLLLTTAYSLFLKPVALLDVLALTSLYTLRIIAGALAIDVPLSYWLLAFSMFIFFSLALSKRFSELYNLKQKPEGKQTARGYHTEDLPVVSLFGISSGYLSVLIMVLYIHDLQADSLYDQPLWLWPVAIAVLYWISRIWLLAHRGVLHEDPVLFAIHDRTSYIVALLVAICLLLAL